MTALQKAWVRTAGVLLLVTTLGVVGGVFTWPESATVLQGRSADIYCRSFFNRLTRDDAVAVTDFDTTRTQDLLDKYELRVRLLVTGELSEAERNALFEGSLGTTGKIGALERGEHGAEAMEFLKQRYQECEARLAQQGVPEPPPKPEVGSSEWHMQNR